MQALTLKCQDFCLDLIGVCLIGLCFVELFFFIELQLYAFFVFDYFAIGNLEFLTNIC